MSPKRIVLGRLSDALEVVKGPKERIWLAESVLVWFVAAVGAGVVGAMIILADRQLYPLVMAGILGTGYLIDGAWAFVVQRHLRHEVRAAGTRESAGA